MTRRIAIVALFLSVSCGKKDSADKASGDTVSADTVSANKKSGDTVAREPTVVEGPSVVPVVTNTITFVTPKPGVTWAEMAFPCYRAAIELEPGTSVAAPFYQASPMVQPALAAAGIDIERGDMAALGGWDCGGTACLYIAANLRQPDKLAAMVAMIAPQAKQPGPLHWTFEAPGVNGKRTIHIRAVPIQWGNSVPNDPWSKAMAEATHVIFVTGLSGGADAEPLATLVTGDAATERVKSAEAVLSDTRGRCVVGTTGTSDFKPGFELESSRFAMAAPPAKTDHLAKLVGSNKTLDVEIELTLSAPAGEKDVQRWIEEARMWAAGIAGPIRMQFAGQGQMVQTLFDAAALIANEGFRHELDDKLLRLSWRTDRIERSHIQRLEADLERAVRAGQ